MRHGIVGKFTARPEGINEHLSELVRILSDALPGKRFRPCRALLPVDDWCIVPGRLRFGLPWPWGMSDSPSELVDATGGAVSGDSVAVVAAPRSDQDVTFNLWRDDGSLIPMLPGIGERIAATYHGSLVGERRVQLAGTRAVLVVVDGGGERVWRLVADWSGHLLHGELSVPTSTADGYAPHLETMLATWAWG